MDATEYFRNLELENRQRQTERNNGNEIGRMNSPAQIPDSITFDENEINNGEKQQEKMPQSNQKTKNVKRASKNKAPKTAADKEIIKEKMRLYQQKHRATMSEEARAAYREADRLKQAKARAAKRSEQVSVRGRSLSQNFSTISTPIRRFSSATFATSSNLNDSVSLSTFRKRRSLQMSTSQVDLVFDTSSQSTPKRRSHTQFSMPNTQIIYSNNISPQFSAIVSPVPTQPLQYLSPSFDPTFEQSQIVQNQLIKSINDISNLIELNFNLEDNGIVALESILSESEELEFQGYNDEEKENMLIIKKSEICTNLKALIEKLIEETYIEDIKQVIFETKNESETSKIISFIFDGIQNIENFYEIQIAPLISTIRLYIKKAKFISRMAFEETSTIRESLKRLLNKRIVGISGTDDYENRRILGFSLHIVNRNEHVTIGQPIRELFPQVYYNFMTMNAANTDYIFVHPGQRNPNIQNQSINVVNGSSQNSNQTVTVTSSQNSEILIENIQSSQISNFSIPAFSVNNSQSFASNVVESSQNSISTITVSNSQATEIINEVIPNSSQTSANSQTSQNSQTSNISEELIETEIIQSEGFKLRSEAKTYINATRGYLCNHECPAISSDFSKKLIPYLQNLAYANTFNIFYVLEEFKLKCLPKILLHAPCFQGLRGLKRKYDDLDRHVKIMASINQTLYETNFKALENLVNNQKLPKQIAAELHTKFLPKVSDLTEHLAKEKYGTLLEKFLQEDKDIAASHCQICQQLLKASSLVGFKYEIVENLCPAAIFDEIKEFHHAEPEAPILICKSCRTDIRKKKLPSMATTNELGVTSLDGVLGTLTKLEWILLKPVRISETIINIYPNENNCEMIDAINSVEDGKPITVTTIPSSTTIKIYIHGKIDNLQPIISRPKLFEAYQILKEINPFYAEIEYDPSFQFTDDCVKFKKKGVIPNYGILIDENNVNQNVANIEFYGIDQDLNPMQQGTVLNRFLKRKHLHLYINSVATNHEVQCFPNCFPDGKFGRFVPTRKFPISDTLWIKNRVNHISRQFLDPEFLMFLKSLKDTKALFGAVAITFREIKDVINVNDLIQTFQQERYSVVMDSTLTTKFNAVRGSIDYFNGMQNDLECVVDTIGPASYFVTANPSIEDWENLKNTYLKIYSNLSELDYNCDEMISKDPVIFATYFRNKLHNLLRNVILNKNGPFGELIHHFFRIDYQETNLTHAHMIFWSKNETTFEKLGEEKCIELIDKCVTCRIPDPISEAFAYKSVMKFQKHNNKCSRSCMVKTMDGENFECRYGFPKFSREYTKLNLKNGKLFEDYSMGCRQYELKRSQNEELIGDYNLPLLLLWQGNINVQVLISEDNSKLIQYLTKPLSAKVLSRSNEVNNRITKSLTMSKLSAISSQCLKNKPVGPVECVEHLLNMPLCGSSFNVIFISTNPPEKRRKTLATKIDPEKLTPENVYQTTMLDNYLPDRDEYLQSFSYYNISSNFKIVRKENIELNPENELDQDVNDSNDENFIDDTDFSEFCNPPLPSQSSQFSDIASSQNTSNPSEEDIKKQEKFGNLFHKAKYSIFNEKSPTFCHPKLKIGTLFKSGWKNVYFFKRAKPIIPRFYLPFFDEAKFEKANDYFRRLCVMFIPFNKEADLKSDDGYIKKFMDFYENLLENNKDAANDILRITKNQHERLLLQFKAAKKLQNEINKETEEFGIETIEEPDNNSKQLAWLKISEIDKTLHEQMIQNLNEIQGQIFDDTVTTISDQENAKALQQDPVKQIIKFISGVAGTGKSHLIKCLSEHLILNYTILTDEGYAAPAVIIGAPTAFAASPLNGNTIHSIFSLGQLFSRYKTMFSEIASEKKVLFENCKLIIIDEISMCSNITLMEINLRCQEITGSKKLFGGMNVMVFGDLLQLPPIKSLQVFEPLSATQVYSKFVGGVGLNLWQEFEYSELMENMRQLSAQIYSKALERLRIGESTEEDIKMFKSRIIPSTIEGESLTFMEMAKYYLNLCEKSGTVMAIFPKVDDVNLFNTAVMKCKKLNIIDIFATNSGDSESKNKNITSPWLQKCFDKNKISKLIPLPKSDTPVSDQYPNRKTNLSNLIRCAIGCRLMLKKNLDMSKGLINGALGTLRDIRSHEIPMKNGGFKIFVDKLLIEFDHAVGEIIEISRDTVSFKNFKGTFVSQSQFPISVAYGCTIHKAQGASLDTVMVSLENLFEGGQAYVALSRVKTLEGLHISIWDQTSFKVNTKAILEYNRLRATINLPPFNVLDQDEIVPIESDEKVLQGNGKLPILTLVNENDRQNCINSTLQILRMIPELFQWLQNHNLQAGLLNEIKEIYEYIGKDEIANTENFSGTVSNLNEEGMYDPKKLIELISNHCDNEIRSLWQFKKTIMATCGICTMEYEIPSNLIEVLKLVLSQSLGKQTYEELLTFNENFQQIRQCLICTKTGPQMIKITLSWPIHCQAKYLFVSLDRFNRQQSKVALKLTNHHLKRQKIGGKFWDLIGAIEHKGASQFSGSYIPWLSDEKEEGRKTFWHKICDDSSFEIVNFNHLLSNNVILLYKMHKK